MTLPLEEEIIRHARQNPERLPALEMILDRFVLSVAPAFKAYTTVLPDMTSVRQEYLSTAEAIETLPSSCLIAVSTCKPWAGRLACAVEPDLLFAVLELMLGGSRKPSSEWTPRPFTAIERSIGKRIAELVLGVLGNCFEPITKTDIEIDSVETLPKAMVLAPPTTPSILARFKIDLDGRAGHVSLILPYGAFGAIRGLLTQSFHGGSIASEGWDSEMGHRLSTADANVTAVLTEIRMPLSRMLELRKGDVVDLGVATDHEVSGRVNGTTALRGAFGYRASGSLAIRVSERLIEREEALRNVRDDH